MSPKAPALLTEESVANMVRLLTDFAGNDFRDAVKLARAIEAEVRTLAAGEQLEPRPYGFESGLVQLLNEARCLSKETVGNRQLAQRIIAYFGDHPAAPLLREQLEPVADLRMSENGYVYATTRVPLNRVGLDLTNPLPLYAAPLLREHGEETAVLPAAAELVAAANAHQAWCMVQRLKPKPLFPDPMESFSSDGFKTKEDPEREAIIARLDSAWIGLRAALAGVGLNEGSAHPVDAASTTLPLGSDASRGGK